ncbi:phosphatase PAP2 family protein [Rubinisphaera margarita]|uniref:phosphatase PAP2 family protein n=1 Tax=Rubinisphaera margarita TaxID=2909586 RepID=UPI001EE7FD91|nr:phosphatase PAP2 family protein [Rubinisphaera margarita]MCG6157416.1 phosphatase PAP2 family protein [Rubinisphaera margarita]
MQFLRKIPHPIQKFMTWLGSHELATLVLVGLVAAGTWGFVELADEVREGESEKFDRTVLLSMRQADDVTDPLGPHWVEETARDVTALGGTVIVTFLTIGVAGFLFLQGKRTEALFLVLAVVSGMLLSTGLKYFFDRPRPDLVPHGQYVYTRSFPSGHSAISAVVYLTLGALLARVQTRHRIKAYFLLLAFFLTILIGISRVYLGVHWPTDVLAGWTMGATWAAGCWLVFRWLQRHNSEMENPDDASAAAKT